MARRLLKHEPKAVVVTALTREEAEGAIAELQGKGSCRRGRRWWPVGDIFLPEAVKRTGRGAEVLADAEAQAPPDDSLRRADAGSGRALDAQRPPLAASSGDRGRLRQHGDRAAYQNVFDSAGELRAAPVGNVDLAAVEGTWRRSTCRN